MSLQRSPSWQNVHTHPGRGRFPPLGSSRSGFNHTSWQSRSRLQNEKEERRKSRRGALGSLAQLSGRPLTFPATPHLQIPSNAHSMWLSSNTCMLVPPECIFVQVKKQNPVIFGAEVTINTSVLYCVIGQSAFHCHGDWGGGVKGIVEATC